jgi:DNA polymerase-3 subunit epsilon
MTTITDEDLVRAPTFDEIALEVERLLKDAVFVAHNVGFDYAFIKSEFKRLQMDFTAPTLCSASLSRSLFPKDRRHNLDSLIERHGIKIGTRHRALPDADAVLQFFQKISKEIDEKTLRQAIEWKLGRTAIEKAALKELPDDSGVYFFYGPERELLYVGKSKHVRTRARSHFRDPSAKGERLQEETAAVEAVQTSGELSALLLEASLIKKESPLYNRALRRVSKLVLAVQKIGADGYSRIVLETHDNFEADPSVVSIFRTMRQAKDTLRRLADEHKLCQKFLGLEKGSGPCFAYQLGQCDGVCLGSVSAEAYNLRVDEAFKSRRLKSWDYPGGVVIEEKSGEDAGTLFFIDNWAILGSFKYESGAYQSFLPAKGVFDYDSYKILARYMRATKNRDTIKPLSRQEFQKALAACKDDRESVIA